MLLPIPDILTPEQVTRFRARLQDADWTDGRITAGHQSARAKDNAQLPDDSPVARELGDELLQLLSRNSTFFSAARSEERRVGHEGSGRLGPSQRRHDRRRRGAR